MFRDGLPQFHRVVSGFEAFVVDPHENVDDSRQSEFDGLVGSLICPYCLLRFQVLDDVDDLSLRDN